MIANCAVRLADGRELSLLVRNLGFSKAVRGYVTAFYLDGKKFESVFRSKFYMPEQCPTPDMRLARDLEVIEEEVVRRFACTPDEIMDLD